MNPIRRPSPYPLPRALARLGAATLALLLALVPPTPAAADDALPPPTGEVLLVVRGAIERTNVGDEAHLDRAALDRLPRASFTSGSPWDDDGVHHYEGVPLDALLAAVGARTDRFTARGVDDYSATFEGVDLERYPVLVAWRRDGHDLTVRTLGPLRIMFPFSDHPELLTQTNTALSVWQLVSMDVR